MRTNVSSIPSCCTCNFLLISTTMSNESTGIEFHLPGYNYLGPGTHIPKTDKPVDRADEIAQKHDLSYYYARSEADIRNADKTAIGEFFGDYKQWQALLGGTILSAKFGLESLTGVLYPQVRNGQTKNK